MLVDITPEFLDSFVQFYTDGDKGFKKELEIVFKYKKNYFDTYRVISVLLSEYFSSNFLDDRTLRVKTIELSEKLLKLMRTSEYEFDDDEVKEYTEFNLENVNKVVMDIFGKELGFSRIAKSFSKKLFDELQSIYVMMKIEKFINLDVDVQEVIKENKILRKKLSSLTSLLYEKNREIRDFWYKKNEEIIEFLEDIPESKLRY